MAGMSGSLKSRLLGGLAGAIALAVASQSHALTVLGSFDSSITSLSNAAAVEASINSALQFYSVFTNPTTVNILFQVGGGLGGSSTGIYSDTYAGYTGKLAANATANPQNAVLQTALANLAYGNHKPDIGSTSADFRALGYNAPATFGADGVFGSGHIFDGVISLNTSIMNFTDTVDPSLYPADPVIQHEIDEILGVGGSGSMVAQPFGPSDMGAEDLYRYSSSHTASFTTNSNATSYFSIDGGVTDIMGFNQGPNGDYADWVTDCGGAQSVQDWQGCPGKPQLTLNVNSPEVIALQAIGYDLGATGTVPEPSAWALMITGFGMMGGALRRRRTLAVA